jgi:hypothetical protein
MKARTLLAAVVATTLATTLTGSLAWASASTSGQPNIEAGVNTPLSSSLNSLYSTFKVPKVTCPNKPTYPLTIEDELVGDTSDSVASAGLKISIQCSGSTPSYTSTLFAVNASESENVDPNESIQLKVYENNSSNTSEVQMTDLSNQQTVTETGSGFVGDVSAQLTAQGGYDVNGNATGPYPIFTTIPFKNVTADTDDVSTFLNQWYEADAKNHVMIALALNKSGTGLTLTFEKDK